MEKLISMKQLNKHNYLISVQKVFLGFMLSEPKQYVIFYDKDERDIPRYLVTNNRMSNDLAKQFFVKYFQIEEDSK